jgi:hypothetical protein
MTPFQQVYTPPPSKRERVFLSDFKDRKKGKGEKGDSKDTVETFIDEYADEAKRGALYSHETKQEMSFR